MIDAPDSPSVDVRAPDGSRVTLSPAVRLERLPPIGRAGVAAAVVVAVAFLLTAAAPLHHTDLWGHLWFGRWIVEHGQFPAHDPFRPSLDTGPPANVPWLAQVLGYLCLESLGLEGLTLAHAALVALAAAVLIAAVRRRGASLAWGVAAAAAGYLLALPIEATIRPQLFGAVAFAATLWAAARLPSRWRPLVWLPAVFALWANLHGSFAIGLAVLGCVAAGQTCDAIAGRIWSAAATGRSQPPLPAPLAGEGPGVRGFCGPLSLTCCLRPWLALGLSTAACCLNPMGPRLLADVAGFAGHGTLEGISEWQPMVLKSLSGALFFGSLAVTAVLLRLSPRRIATAEVLLFLLLALASLSAIRMLAWWALAWPWLVAPHAAAVWNKYRPGVSGEPGAAADPQVTVRHWIVAAGVAALALWWSPGSFAVLSGRHRPDAAVLSSETPAAVAGELEKQKNHGRIYAPMDWADYLVYRTDGSVEPLVHCHVHLIDQATWADFLAIRGGSPRWPELADRHRLDYLVLSTAENGRLIASAAKHPRCKLVWRDARAVVFRFSPPAP